MVDWLVVNAVSGFGPTRIQQLLNYMDVEELRLMIEHEKHALPLPESLLKTDLAPDFSLVESALEWQQAEDNHSIVCFDDPNYPSLLKQISAPPPILFVKGQLEALYPPCIAIVGSRAASRTGLQLAYQFGHELGELAFTGAIVVSGV